MKEPRDAVKKPFSKLCLHPFSRLFKQIYILSRRVKIAFYQMVFGFFWEEGIRGKQHDISNSSIEKRTLQKLNTSKLLSQFLANKQWIVLWVKSVVLVMGHCHVGRSGSDTWTDKQQISLQATRLFEEQIQAPKRKTAYRAQ